MSTRLKTTAATNGRSIARSHRNGQKTHLPIVAAKPRRATPHGLRIAAIDIGTNSLHLVIVEVTDQMSFKILSSEKDLTQLGSAALVQHKLTAKAMNHTLEVLKRYKTISTGLECDVILAYATSAVRESTNGGDFIQMAKDRLDLHVQVISAQEEAYLIYLAVRQAIDLGEGHSLIVDIGGGSAEFIVADQQRPLLLESRKLGASRLTQQFAHSSPISGKDLEELERHVRKQTKSIMAEINALGVTRFIGTSGTMQNLAAMCHMQHGDEVGRTRLLSEMTRDDFDELYRKLLRTTVEERRHFPGLDPGRAEQILAGAVVVKAVFKKLKLDAVDVCDRALREGMIIHYMQTHWPKVRLSVQVRDPRRRSIIELARRCNFDEKHHQQVAKLTLELFDQLTDIHRLEESDRELLEFAALTHDIGWHIGHSGHHKHSYYLIKNGDLEGFSSLETEIIANVARYHRRSMPKKSHEAYMSLEPADRQRVCKMAALLRIADGLDRGHYGNVKKLRTIVRQDLVSILLETSADPELELWAARHKTDMFETVFRRRVKFSAEEVMEKTARTRRAD